ncbi:MAG TPA: hypothetical protein VKU01_03980, partial [Bryobacteraceae bacterium]|nr:hypothetical protein [Bryobacteraceae bacterium]
WRRSSLAFSSALQRRYSFFTCLAPNSPLRRDCESFEAIPQFSAEAEHAKRVFQVALYRSVGVLPEPESTHDFF